MTAHYQARRAPDAWHVVALSSGAVVATFAPGPDGATAAADEAAARNRGVTESGRGRSTWSDLDLRAWRKLHGLTQAALAQRLGIAWLTVQRWESGDQHAPPYLRLLLKALETEL